MARTDTLGNFLTDVADAIRTKKGTSDTITASNFDTEIENLPSSDPSEYFRGSITSTPNSSSNGVNQIIKKIPAITIGSGITSLQYCYANCKAEEIDASSFVTTDVTNMRNMFVNCSNLTSLDLSNFNTGKVTNMQSMFDGCTSLQHLDIRGFDFTIVSSFSSMFGGSASTNVPDDCEIIVADNTAKTWILTNFSRFTNVKTVADVTQ